MKIVRYRADGIINFGIMEEDGTIRELVGTPFDSLNPSGSVTQLSDVHLLAPVEAPRIIGVGLNYAEHAREVGKELPTKPMLFMKPSTTAIGPDETIIYPRQGKNVHYEAELAVVIGSPARRVSEAKALDYVLGYTCGNDVSERTIQFAEMEMGAMLIGKGFDTFCPLGPCITTDLDPGNLQVQARLNGQVKQNERTSDLIFFCRRADFVYQRRLHDAPWRRDYDRHTIRSWPLRPRRCCRNRGGGDRNLEKSGSC